MRTSKDNDGALSENLSLISIKAVIMSGSCHLGRALNVEIVAEYQMIFVLYFFLSCFQLNFWAPSRFRKGWVILLQNLQSNLSFFSIQQKTNKQKYFDI